MQSDDFAEEDEIASMRERDDEIANIDEVVPERSTTVLDEMIGTSVVCSFS